MWGTLKGQSPGLLLSLQYEREAWNFRPSGPPPPVHPFIHWTNICQAPGTGTGVVLALLGPLPPYTHLPDGLATPFPSSVLHLPRPQSVCSWTLRSVSSYLLPSFHILTHPATRPSSPGPVPPPVVFIHPPVNHPHPSTHPPTHPSIHPLVHQQLGLLGAGLRPGVEPDLR